MMKRIRKAKNDIIFFMEQFCYIEDKKTNKCHRIKLSKAQKKFIKHLSKLQKNK
jgi:hypothetical protein